MRSTALIMALSLLVSLTLCLHTHQHDSKTTYSEDKYLKELAVKQDNFKKEMIEIQSEID